MKIKYLRKRRQVDAEEALQFVKENYARFKQKYFLAGDAQSIAFAVEGILRDQAGAEAEALFADFVEWKSARKAETGAIEKRL